MVVHQKATPVFSWPVCESKVVSPKNRRQHPPPGLKPNGSIQRWGHEPWGHHSPHYMYRRTLDRGNWMQIGMQWLACVPSCGSMTNSSVSFLHLPQGCLWSHNSTCTNRLTVIENSSTILISGKIKTRNERSNSYHCAAWPWSGTFGLYFLNVEFVAILSKDSSNFITSWYCCLIKTSDISCKTRLRKI